MNKRDQIREDIIARIKSGTLTPGEKLPSLREFAKQYGVSITPATNACNDLVAKGWLESRPCSGYYVSEKILNYEISDYLSHINMNTAERYSMFDSFISDYSDIVMNQNNDIKYCFGATAVSSSFFPSADFNSTFAHAIRQTPAGLNSQITLHDSPALKREIMHWMLPCRCSNTIDEIDILRSVSDGILLALRACAAPHSVVAVESPGHIGFYFAQKFLDYRVVLVRSDPVTGLDVDQFESILQYGARPACLLLSANFSNPTGAVMPDKNKERLVKICADAGIAIIEDDILGEIYFGENRPTPLKSFDNDNVIYVSGFGKCLIPSTPLAYVAAGKYADKLSFYKHLNTAYVLPALQEALAEFMHSGAAYKYVRFFRAHLKTIVESYCALIREHFPPGTSVRMPEGGMYLWVNLPWSISVDLFCEKAKKAGISISPNRFFQPQAQNVANAFRINCAAMPWNADTRSALIQLGEIAGKMYSHSI